MERSKPALATRLLVIALLFGFLRIPRNPLVVLGSQLGLSPSPLERIFHIEGPFSGMTEASHRLAHFDLRAAISANPVVFIFWTSVLAMILTWRFPTMNRRSDEVTLFTVVVLATLANNLW